jgi:coenzyme F420-0:L-glutamate ligase/coenzyme F420-1:gamma-L-glutamate ligase
VKLEILPVLGIPDVSEGDDLAALISLAAPWLRDGDVLVVTSKVVSKAEGRLVDVPTAGPERLAARDEILAAETARPVARRGATRIVQTHHGFVMASAGIDASNVDPSRLVLLPKDPDASARSLRAALRERHGADVAVIVSDTMGRPWRNGLTDVALGVAGMAAIRDYRGEVDPYGNELSITQVAVVDELASAGELVKGKFDQIPVAVVRGYPLAPMPSGAKNREAFAPVPYGAEDQEIGATWPHDGPGAAALIRDAEHDLFALGTAEARAAGLRAAGALGESDLPAGVAEPVDPAALHRAVAAVARAVAPGTVFTPVTDPEVRARLAASVPDWPAAATSAITCGLPENPDPAALIRLGADLHRLRAALAAEDVRSAVLPPPTGSGLAAVLAL